MRYHGSVARIELEVAQLDGWLEPGRQRALRDAVLQAGFERVVLDVRGFRSGSLNVLAGIA